MIEQSERIMPISHGASAETDAIVISAYEDGATREERLYSVKFQLDAEALNEIRMGGYHGGAASDDDEDPGQAIVLFWGNFLRRDDAVALAWELAIPAAITDAITNPAVWFDVQPSTFEQARERLRYTLPGCARIADEPGIDWAAL